MKKSILLILPLLLAGCGNDKKQKNRNVKTYIFEVLYHITANQTSEVQEKTHDPYLACCERGANSCFIEVPYGDKKKELELFYTGYIIEYDCGVYCNNGWELVE